MCLIEFYFELLKDDDQIFQHEHRITKEISQHHSSIGKKVSLRTKSCIFYSFLAWKFKCLKKIRGTNGKSTICFGGKLLMRHLQWFSHTVSIFCPKIQIDKKLENSQFRFFFSGKNLEYFKFFRVNCQKTVLLNHWLFARKKKLLGFGKQD